MIKNNDRIIILFFSTYKDTKKSIHFQINGVISWINDVISQINTVVLRNYTDDLRIDAEKYEFVIGYKKVYFCFNSMITPLSSSPNVEAISFSFPFNLPSSNAVNNSPEE